MNSSSIIKTQVIVVDQGNTLIMDPFLKVMDLQESIFRGICRQYGVETAAVSLSEAWESANREVDYPFCTHFTQEEPIIQLALRKLNIEEDTAAIMGPDLLREYRQGLKKIIVSDPRTREVKTTLESLAADGKKLGVFSNDRRIGLGLVLNTMGIRPLFQYSETSEEIGIEKPDTRVFRRIIDFFQTEPANITYVGDDPIRDIDAAKSLGLKAVLYKVDPEKYTESWRDYSRQSRFQPDAAIENFAELAGH
jgi:HAD superfamily hydrolase (TIGR01549 family)